MRPFKKFRHGFSPIRSFKISSSVCYIATLAILSLTPSCSDDPKPLKPLQTEARIIDKSTNLEFEYCGFTEKTTEKMIQIIFIVDNSGSNYQRTATGTPQVGTDPDNARFQAIIDYVKDQKEEIYYSIIAFGSDASVACYQFFSDENSTSISTDTEEVIKVVNSITQGGGPQVNLPPECNLATNYVKAIDAAEDVKKIFLELAAQKYPIDKKNSGSVVLASLAFHISDGLPRILVGDDIYQQTREDIFPKIDNFIYSRNLFDGSDIKNKVRLKEYITQYNTGFYTRPPIDSGPKQLLVDMSEIGNGFFVDLGDDPTFDTLTVPKLIDNFVGETPVVINRSAVWEDNGGEVRYFDDSDSDGISDQRELALGLNPNAPDSNKNFIGDLIEWRFSTDPSGAGLDKFPCVGDKNFSSDEDRDLLNHCEELILGSDPEKSDTNKDGIPDGVSFFAGISPVVNDGESDPDRDGLTNIEELQLNLPPILPNTLITKEDLEQAQKYYIEPSEKPGCKRLVVENFRVVDDLKDSRIDAFFYAKQSNGMNKKLLYLTDRILSTKEYTYPDLERDIDFKVVSSDNN